MNQDPRSENVMPQNYSALGSPSGGSVAPHPSGFSSAQLRKLLRGVDSRHIHTRDVEGRHLSYIEGWYAIAQANEVFGYAGWDREMVHFERVIDRSGGTSEMCGYIARVRIRVRAGTTEVIREGTGWGVASARTAAGAHERALKSAETDATKRALSTFGANFGLKLYDRGQKDPLKPALKLFAPDGQLLADDLSPEAYCTGLRQLIDLCADVQAVDSLSRCNAGSITDLRGLAPSLRNVEGAHFSDLLLRLVERARRRLEEAKSAKTESRTTAPKSFSNENLSQSQPAKNNNGPVPNVPTGETSSSILNEFSVVSLKADLADSPSNAKSSPSNEHTPIGRVDKSQLRIGCERKVRDKEHLRRVRDLPCLVCNRQPSHAHHLRFAQSHGLGQKVSDEFVVPLCALHHGDLHRSQSEIQWWANQKIEPLAVSSELWEKHRANL